MKQIWVVDDDDSTRTLLADALQASLQDTTVRTYDDPRTACSEFKSMSRDERKAVLVGIFDLYSTSIRKQVKAPSNIKKEREPWEFVQAVWEAISLIEGFIIEGGRVVIYTRVRNYLRYTIKRPDLAKKVEEKLGTISAKAKVINKSKSNEIKRDVEEIIKAVRFSDI